MSGIGGKVGKWELAWRSVPRGPSGSAEVEIGGKLVSVSWRRDRDGIWLELPHGLFGFDLEGELSDEGGMTFQVRQRFSPNLWSGASFSRAGEQAAQAGGGGKKKAARVRAQMPGKIVRVLAKAGDRVERDQPVLVMEAMKMENEIRAPEAGKITKMAVAEGQAVESSADLFYVDSE